MNTSKVIDFIRGFRVAAMAGLAIAVATGLVGMDDINQFIASGVGFAGVVVWKLAHLA